MPKIDDPAPFHLYFAFGSNLFVPRLQARVGEFEILGASRVSGRVLRFHKRGADGSGKADCCQTPDQGQEVHGIIYRISAEQKQDLDEIEGVGRGYREARSLVTHLGSRKLVDPVPAFFYEATSCSADMRPFDWYHGYVLQGARDHGLPAAYVRSIAAFDVQTDPDTDRARQHWERLRRVDV